MTGDHRTFPLGGDLPVNRIGFGALKLTDWRPAADRSGTIAVARRAVELGVDLIDTADSYALGANEELLAEALHPYRNGLVIATKAGRTRASEREWTPLGRPEYLRQQAELSLRRLRLERIELFQLHRVDPRVPFADQVGALARLRRDGVIHHIGLSEVSLDQLRAAREVVEIASVQNIYNLTDRRHEDVLDYCTANHIAFIPWLPLADGAHAGRGGALADVAREVGATPVQVALAWLLRRSPVMLPIPGTSSLSHLEENVAAADVILTDEQFDRLDRIASPVGVRSEV